MTASDRARTTAAADQTLVLTVSPERLAASVWRATLSAEPSLRVVRTAHRLGDALNAAPDSDMILFSPGEAVEAGVAWVRALADRQGGAPLVAVGLPREEAVALAYVEAGASAFVFQDESVRSVLEAIRAVAMGEASIPADMAPALIHRLHRLRQSYVDPRQAGQSLEALTPREHDVLGLLARGLTNHQIAERLEIEPGTVKNHVHNILDKLETDDRRRAAAYHAAATGGWRSRA